MTTTLSSETPGADIVSGGFIVNRTDINRTDSGTGEPVGRKGHVRDSRTRQSRNQIRTHQT